MSMTNEEFEAAIIMRDAYEKTLSIIPETNEDYFEWEDTAFSWRRAVTDERERRINEARTQ